MSSEPDPTAIQISYSKHFPSLLTALKTVDRPGDYFATGSAETPMPSIGVGDNLLSFPVPAAQAKALQKAGEKAPYGRGADTIVDKSVRDVWQIAPEHMKISGEGWSRTFENIVSRVAEDLGCEKDTVSAEFYKLLIYAKGGFFKAHRDSEKTGGMFGTLIVVLPSAHQGGELTIRHAGRETTLDLSALATSEVHFAAFYADCEHEVAPIRSGHRVCLVYNLVRVDAPAKGASKASAELSVPDNRPAVAETAWALRQWKGRYSQWDGPRKLVYLLEHRYTAAGLSFKGLKNGDDALAKVFLAASREAGFALHLAIVHIEESGWAEFIGDYHSYRGYRRWEDEDEEDEEDSGDYEIGEVCDDWQSIDDWIDVEDRAVPYGAMPLDSDELLPPGALDGTAPDSIHFSEATGNEGASFERTYLRAALVLWPEDAFDRICLSAGLQAGVARLNDLARQSGAEAKTSFARFAPLLCKEWKTSPYRHNRISISQPVEPIIAHGDAGLLAECLGALLPRHYDGEDNAVIVEALAKVKPADAGKILTDILRKYTRSHCGYCLDLWNQAAKQTCEDVPPKWLLDATEQLIDLLPKARSTKVEPVKVQVEWWEERRASEQASVEKTDLTSEIAADFLLLVYELCSETLCAQAVTAVMANTKAFAPDIILPLCLAHLYEAGEEAFPEDLLGELWRHCGAFLARRSRKPPAPPKDWKQTVQWKCQCADCSTLRRFAAAPDEKVLRMPMAKARRMHIHRIIDANGIDMTHVTERAGSPHTLVCKKKRTAHEKKCARHAADVEIMKQLIEMGEALLPEGGDETEAVLAQIRKAIAAADG